MIELRWWREQSEEYKNSHGIVTFELICKLFKKSIV